MVLLAHHIYGLYLLHTHVAAVRQNLALDYLALGVPGVLAQARGHVGLVDSVDGVDGVAVAPDPKSGGSQKDAQALKAWKHIRDQLAAGEIDENDYKTWKVPF